MTIDRGRGVGWLAGMLVAAVLAAPAHAAEARTWRHGILEAKSDAGIIMMVGHGFAAKEGVKLDLLQFKNDVVELQALLAGELDSYEGGAAGAMVAAARGADVKIIGCEWPGLPYDVFVRSNIKTVADLKGKTFAISSPGATPDIVARALLAREHVPASSVRFANLGSDLDRFKALVAGVADATVVSGEYAPIAAQQGIRPLIAARDVVPNYLRLCIMTTGKILAERPDDAVRFLTAEMKALAYALSHRAETLQLTHAITHDKPDDPRPAYIFDDAVRSHSVDPTLALPRDKLDWMQQLLVRDGKLPKPIDIATVIDPSIRAKALAAIGR